MAAARSRTVIRPDPGPRARLAAREPERLHASLLKLAALPDEELRALVGSVLEGEELVFALITSRRV
jgi:hypothetical protein